ncbi:MAG: hypothetical protein ACK4RK_05495 [Gemmataceae bacterium]
MNPALLLLTASCVVGGPGDASCYCHPGSASQPSVQVASYGSERPGPLSGLRQKIGSIFGRKGREEIYMPQQGMTYHPHSGTGYTNPSAIPTPNQTGRLVPVPTTHHTSAKVSQPEPAGTDHFANMMGHDENYQWITGQLSFLNGQWVVRYTIPGEQDRYGGVVSLIGSSDMREFQDGDLVCVHGQIAGQSQNGVAYQVSEIHLIKRGNR